MLNVPPSSTRDESTDMLVKDEKQGMYIREKITSVPDWMYHKREDWCLWTLPAFMWTINLLASIFHLILIVVTCIVSSWNGRGLDTPTFTIYKRKTVWNGGANGTFMNNATTIFTPSFVEAGWEVPITYVTISFFALSASFHAFICLTNFNQAFSPNDETEKKYRKIGMFTGWYFRYLHDCRQPLRWIECECTHYHTIIPFLVLLPGTPVAIPKSDPDVYGQLQARLSTWNAYAS